MARVDCALCHRPLEGDAYRWQDYAGKVGVVPIGIQCQHCGSVYCNLRHKKELKFSAWSGWDKSVCPHCDQPFGPSKALLPVGAALQGAAPVPLFEAQAEPVAGAVAATPSAAGDGCPDCGAPSAQGNEYCPACGHDYATGRQRIGPATFAYPAVKNAYRPGGKITTSGAALMLVSALLAGVIGGMLVTGGDLLISLFAGASGLGGILIAVAFIAYVFVGGGAGILIGRAVARGAVAGRSPNPNAAAVFGVAGGVIAFLVFLALRSIILGAEAADSGFDTLKLAFYLVSLLIVAGYTAREALRNRPFCATCGAAMRQTILKPLPAHYEQQVMQGLAAGAYQDVAQIAVTPCKDTGNALNITLWTCTGGHGPGYVNIEKVQSRATVYNGQTKTLVDRRLIYSAPAGQADLAPLQEVAARF
jgi:hypothetical protein